MKPLFLNNPKLKKFDAQDTFTSENVEDIVIEEADENEELPEEQVKKVVDGVKAKLTVDNGKDLLNKVKGIFG